MKKHVLHFAKKGIEYKYQVNIFFFFLIMPEKPTAEIHNFLLVMIPSLQEHYLVNHHFF